MVNYAVHKTAEKQNINSYSAESVFQFSNSNYITGRVELVDKEELFNDQPAIKELLARTAILEIGKAGELNLKDLAARLGLDNSTLSRTVESLVQDGLADRTPSKEDRRATVIRLNEKGRTALDRIKFDLESDWPEYVPKHSPRETRTAC